MENSTDKSDGTGCGGCSWEDGKTCEGCIHKDDTVNKALRQSQERKERLRK